MYSYRQKDANICCILNTPFEHKINLEFVSMIIVAVVFI